MNAMNEVRIRKAELRAEVRARRDAIPPDERARLSAVMMSRLLDILTAFAPRMVMLFSSFGSEVSTRGVIEALARGGTQIALPLVAGTDLRSVLFRPGDPTRTARYGAAEPVAAPEVPPEALDAIVVPGLAFDREGYRVGYGRGYYDRFLARVRPSAPRVGIAFGVQIVDAVPHRDGDERVDAIVTERDIVRCQPARAPLEGRWPGP